MSWQEFRQGVQRVAGRFLGRPALEAAPAQRFALEYDEDLARLFEAQCSSPAQVEERTWCDVEDMRPFLPVKPQHVVDLGCGSGRLSVALNASFSEWEAKFWLVDAEEGEPSELAWGQYQHDGVIRLYNQRQLTERLCRLNGLTLYEYVGVTRDLEWSTLPPAADLLFSNRSIGWHFPIDIYADLFPRILAPDAVCIFTWHPDLEQNLPSYFATTAMARESFQGRDLLVARYCG